MSNYGIEYDAIPVDVGVMVLSWVLHQRYLKVVEREV
jgi:hypothetical protein